MALLYEVNADGTTVFLATHDRQLVASAPGPVFTLDRGRLLYLVKGVLNFHVLSPGSPTQIFIATAVSTWWRSL